MYVIRMHRFEAGLKYFLAKPLVPFIVHFPPLKWARVDEELHAARWDISGYLPYVHMCRFANNVSHRVLSSCHSTKSSDSISRSSYISILP